MSDPAEGPGSCEVCGEQIVPGTLNDILDHLRVVHPNIYGDGPEMWPDGGPVITFHESVPVGVIIEELGRNRD